MDTIAFLIADELMQQSVYTILHIYKDKLEAHDITTTVTIIDFPHLIDQARSLIRQGAKVIITNSGSHQILTKAIDNVPILCLFSSTNDALYTLRSIAPKYKQITCCSMRTSCSTKRPVRKSFAKKSSSIPATAWTRRT